MATEKHISGIFYPSLIIIQCVIFGMSFIAVKSLLESYMPPFLLMAIRFAIGFFSLLVFSKMTNLSKKYVTTFGYNKIFSKEEITFGAITGVILFISFALQTIGAKTTTPAKNGLFTDLFVVFVPVITMIFGTRKFEIKPLVLAIFAFLGVMIVMNVFSPENSSFTFGDLLSILCGVGFAIHFLVMDKFAKMSTIVKTASSLNPYNFIIIQLLTVCIISIVFSFSVEIGKYSAIDWTSVIGWLLFLGIASSAIAYMLQIAAQTKISVETVSVLSCSEAIFTLSFSLIFGFDNFNWLFIIGALIIITAMVLSSVELK